MYCSKCGAQNNDSAAFCNNCGGRLAAPNAQSNPPSAQQSMYVGYQQQGYYYRPQPMLSRMGYSRSLNPPKDSFLFAAWEKALIMISGITSLVFSGMLLISAIVESVALSQVVKAANSIASTYGTRNSAGASQAQAIALVVVILLYTFVIFNIVCGIGIIRLSRKSCITLIVFYGLGFIGSIITLSQTSDIYSANLYGSQRGFAIFELIFFIIMIPILSIVQYRLSTSVQAPRIKQLNPEEYGRRFLDDTFSGATWACPKCGTTNKGKDIFCQSCGENKPTR